MLNLPRKLHARDAPIRVGVIGAGLFGTKLTDQIERAPGMITAAIADIETAKAHGTYAEAGVPKTERAEVESAADATAAIDRGDRAILDDGLLLAETPVDVIVEATGIPTAGARHAYKALTAGKHLVLVTVETDTVVGPTLADIADENDVTYTLAYGDQPAIMVELVDWARTIGMDVVAAGRGSMYTPDYRLETPDTVFDRFGYDDDFVEEHNLNARMYNSFLDGTKISVETCALANAVGLEPDVPGMHMETLEPTEVPETLCPDADGGVLSGTGRVEAISSLYPDGSTTDHDLSWGMFVVTTTPNEGIQSYLNENRDHGYHIGSDGKYAFFYRPHHLPGIETPISVANAAIRNEPTGAAQARHADVVGAAKRDLEPGDELDGGGGYTVYGRLETADDADANDHVPFELLHGAEITNPVAQDAIVTYDDVTLPDSFLRDLRENPASVSL